MPPVCNPEKCDGCASVEGGEANALCVNVCPGDLMILVDTPQGKRGQCRELTDCADCMTCVKYCPKQALETRLPYEICAFGSRLLALVGDENIAWTLISPDGRVDRLLGKI